MSAPSDRNHDERGAAPLLRRALLVLSGIALVGTTVELVIGRHWDSLEQVIPFGAIALAGMALWLIAARPTRRRLRLARGLCLIVLAVSELGVWNHIEGNQESGALDSRFADRWESMSAADRWWRAASGGVGPAPPLAPGVLAETALMLLAATLRHPATELAGARSEYRPTR